MSRIAVLAAPDSWYAGDLRRAAECRHEVVVLPFTQLTASLGDERRISSVGHDLRHFDGVIVRTMPPGSLEQVIFRMNALALLEDQGVTIVNPPRSLEVAVDKYLTLARLQAAGFKTPRTRVTQTADDAMIAWESIGPDVVIKPLFGGEGRGILRVNDADLAYRTFRTLERLDAAIYIQEFIPHHGHDLRLFCLGTHVWGMIRRNATDWRTNVTRGATTEPLEITDELREAALRASSAVGTLVAGVDLLPGLDGSLYAIEVNAVPGWKALARTLNRDIAREILDFVDTLARPRRRHPRPDP